MKKFLIEKRPNMTPGLVQVTKMSPIQYKDLYSKKMKIRADNEWFESLFHN